MIVFRLRLRLQKPVCNPVLLMTPGRYSLCGSFRCSSIASLTYDLKSMPFLSLILSTTYIFLMYWSLCSSPTDITKLFNTFNHFILLSLTWNLAPPWKPTSLQATYLYAAPFEVSTYFKSSRWYNVSQILDLDISDHHSTWASVPVTPFWK